MQLEILYIFYDNRKWTTSNAISIFFKFIFIILLTDPILHDLFLYFLIKLSFLFILTCLHNQFPQNKGKSFRQKNYH